jgi:hypothetical protein
LRVSTVPAECHSTQAAGSTTWAMTSFTGKLVLYFGGGGDAGLGVQPAKARAARALAPKAHGPVLIIRSFPIDSLKGVVISPRGADASL